MEHWRGVWRRSQNLAYTYARRFRENQILYVSNPLNLTYAIRTGQIETIKQFLRRGTVSTAVGSSSIQEGELKFESDGMSGTTYSTQHGCPNIHFLTPIKIFPNSLPVGKRFNEAIARRQVQRAMTEIKMVSPALWINPYWGYHYAGRVGEVCTIYDIGDDWNAIKQSSRAMRWTREEDGYLTKNADAVVVVSEYLRQQKSKVRDDVFLIPNGIDARRYAEVWKRTLPTSGLSRQYQRPILGYTGMLHIERFDIALILETAKAFPEATIILVGPNHLDAEQMRRLTALHNIIIEKPIHYFEVPLLMSAFDVCLVPNLVNDFSESQNPLKLFEYLASGLPIVSTNVAGFRDYPDLVRIANTPQEFIQGIREALAEGTTKAPLRQAAVQSETWDARLDALLEVIEYAKRGNR